MNLTKKILTATLLFSLQTFAAQDFKKILNEDQLVDINNNFALKLYQELASKDGNLFFSPYSISSALAMTFHGANNNTKDEMSLVLGFPVDAEFAHNFHSLGEKFKLLNNTGAIELSVANALWAQQDYKFLDSYLDITKKYYNSAVYSCDFKSAPAKETKRINEWVEQQTKEKIKKLIPDGALTELTRLVLTNAVYFKGTWKSKFKKSNTSDDSFFIAEKNAVQLPMMNLTAKFGYYENNEMQLLELPYKGDEVSMIILLPKDQSTLSSLEQSLTNKSLIKLFSAIQNKKVEVTIPKFTNEKQIMLKDTLLKMGMKDAFSSADFSLIDGTKKLYISAVIHKAFVDVNEEGSEAAAATAIIMPTRSFAPEEENIPVFKANHPFIYMIMHRPSRTLLFLGRFVK